MEFLYNELLHKPLFNLLVWVYSFSFVDLGLSIIITTIIVRIILFPLFHKLSKQQVKMQNLQPKIKDIQSREKDKEKQGRQIMELYKQSGVNPIMPLGLTLIQLPVLIALYNIFNNGLSDSALANLYSFVQRPEVLSNSFFGLVDLKSPSIAIAILAAASQYLYAKTMPSSQPIFTYVFTAFMFILVLNFPSAIGLYLIATNILSMVQQKIAIDSIKNERTT